MLLFVLDVTAWFFRICWSNWLSSENCSWQKIHDDCNRRKSNDDGIDIGNGRWCGKINGCFIYDVLRDWNCGGNILCEFPLYIVRNIWSVDFLFGPFKTRESFFGVATFVDNDVTEKDGYSWTVSETVDEEVFVERESERDEHCGCLWVIVFCIEDEDAVAPITLDTCGLCHRRCEAKLAGQLNVLSHSGQLNKMKILIVLKMFSFFDLIKSHTEIQYVQLVDIYA